MSKLMPPFPPVRTSVLSLSLTMTHIQNMTEKLDFAPVWLALLHVKCDTSVLELVQHSVKPGVMLVSVPQMRMSSM